ncbi:hypothetical protein OPQ81_005933 [Rhizoctonia solani]|nr:hypothetical protein OPQ81_005933 [Rhizoctonia solani]
MSKTFTRIPPVPAAASSTPAWSTNFTEKDVKLNLPDGYWIEAFPFRSTPDPNEGPVGPELIAYGLGFMKDGVPEKSQVKMYLNPYHDITKQTEEPPREWESVVIQEFDFPVAATYGNFRPETGLNDVVICHDYGPSMDNLNMEGGIVSYLKNPGNKRPTAHWEARTVGKFPSMHRLKTGRFTQKKYLEIIALPIMLKTSDRTSPAPIIIYTPTECDADGAPSKWATTNADTENFRLIHDVEIIHSEDGGLDKVLIASREGISLLWVDEKTSNWTHENVGLGIPQSRKPFENPYWGSGSVATGRVGKDRFGYIATCEAFHGNLLTVWVKPPTARPDGLLTKEHWRRFVIDDFGPLKPEEFTGTIHNVYCADLDGSGVDTIVVACMGYPEGKGNELPFLDIAGKKLSIVVLPPHKQYKLGGGFKYQNKDYEKDGVKVINGKLIWTREGGGLHERGIAVAPHEAASLLPDAKDNIVRAGDKGAIFVRLASSTETAMPGVPITDMADVATVNCLPFAIDQTARDLVFPWVRCNDRAWAKGRNPPFTDEFYNLVGYSVVYDDDSHKNFCHIQAWTLASYESAEFHNHSDATFCEIHACIVNGTGQGGMWWAKNDEGESHLGGKPWETDPGNLEQYADRVYVKDMEEHGPLWRMNPDNNRYPKFRDNGTVEYPYHAWLAGPWPRPEVTQTPTTYDCWLAFEFPPTEFQDGVPKHRGCAAC